VAGSAKTSVKRPSARTPAAATKSTAAARKVAPSGAATASRSVTPAKAATRRPDRNRYFDVVVLLSVLVFIILAAGVGALVLEQATTWHL
jgi:hypothetical protein